MMRDYARNGHLSGSYGSSVVVKPTADSPLPHPPFDPTSERLQPIQSSRTEYDFRAALSEHDRSGFTYAAASPCSRRL